MISSEEKLLLLLNAADCDGIVQFFRGMSEKKRRELAPATMEWLKNNKKTIKTCTAKKKNPLSSCKTTYPYIFAYLATADLAELASPAGKAMYNLLDPQLDLLFEVIEDRKPVWIGDWMSARMAKEQNSKQWLIYVDCFRKGLCPRIIDEPTVFCMFRRFSECAMPKDNESDKWCDTRFGKKYPEFLDEEIFYPFEHEFKRPFPFSGIDLMVGWPEEYRDKLKKHLLALEREKMIQRDRFLDATLNVLNFRYKEGELRWYADLHRQLNPTSNEIAARQSKYFALLKSDHSSVAGTAFRMLSDAVKTGAIAPAVFLRNTVSLFRQKTKGHCMELVNIAAEFYAQNSAVAEEVCEVALAGLTHAAQDVQTKAAVLLLSAFPDANNGNLIHDLKILLPSLKESIRKKLEPLISK